MHGAYLCCIGKQRQMESFLQFKDYLSINTDRLKNTIRWKQELAERYATDRRAYHQGGKTRFMQNIMVEATDYFHTGSRDYSGTGRRTTQRRIFARLQKNTLKNK